MSVGWSVEVLWVEYYIRILFWLAVVWGVVSTAGMSGNFGGLFHVCWGLWIFGMILQRVGLWPAGLARMALTGFVLLLSWVLAWGTTLYATQVLLPFSLIGFGLLSLMGPRERGWLLRIFFNLASIVILTGAVVWSGFSMRRMWEFSDFLNLRAETVAKVQVEDWAWSDPGDLQALCQALRLTKPYSPDHESPRTVGLRAKVVKKDGTVYSFELFRGNRSDANAAWLKFGVEEYQNRELARWLERAGVKFVASPTLSVD